jgi:hypothetical protein
MFTREKSTPSPCKAFVASICGQGLILFHTGDILGDEINAVGNNTQDLDLGSPPDGVSVWEGVYEWSFTSFECPTDGEWNPKGSYREPTDEEWEALRRKECPWPCDDSSFES